MSIPLSAFIGLHLQELSMSQLEVLEEMHMRAIRNVNAAKVPTTVHDLTLQIELVRRQEQARLEEQQRLAQQLELLKSRNQQT